MIYVCGTIGRNIGKNREQNVEVQNRIIGRRISIYNVLRPTYGSAKVAMVHMICYSVVRTNTNCNLSLIVNYRLLVWCI